MAESFVEKRLLALETKYKNLVPPQRRTGWNRVLVELDGCQIRTGILLSSETEELTPPNTINPMLALRVIRASDWWDDFWQTYTGSEKLLMA